MAKKEVRFRILNKNSKGVTIKMGDKTVNITWDEFNQTFIMVDKYWAVLNEEMMKQQEEIDDKINQIVVSMLIQNGNSDAGTKLTHMAAVGHLITEIQEKYNFTLPMIMQLVRQRLELMNPFMVNPMFPLDGKQKKLRKKYNIPADSPVRPAVVAEEEKPTIGDAFPGLADLRDKMEKEGKVMDEDR